MQEASTDAFAVDLAEVHWWLTTIRQERQRRQRRSTARSRQVRPR
jgi:hypothetical protein